MKKGNIVINGVEYTPVSKVKAKSVKESKKASAFSRLKKFMSESKYTVETVQDNQEYTRKSDGKIIKGKIVTYSNKGKYFVTTSRFWRVN